MIEFELFGIPYLKKDLVYTLRKRIGENLPSTVEMKLLKNVLTELKRVKILLLERGLHLLRIVDHGLRNIFLEE